MEIKVKDSVPLGVISDFRVTEPLDSKAKVFEISSSVSPSFLVSKGGRFVADRFLMTKIDLELLLANAGIDRAKAAEIAAKIEEKEDVTWSGMLETFK